MLSNRTKYSDEIIRENSSRCCFTAMEDRATLRSDLSAIAGLQGGGG
jgi:hypothetical protein